MHLVCLVVVTVLSGIVGAGLGYQDEGLYGLLVGFLTGQMLGCLFCVVSFLLEKHDKDTRS